MITLNNGVIEVSIFKRGVTIASFKHLKDNINIVTRYQDFTDYKSNPSYLGCLIGPLAGRTEQNRYGKELELNDAPNHLHGGNNGLHNHEFVCKQDGNVAVFTKVLDCVFYKVKVKIDQNHCIIEFEAIPDESAILNLTNHMYFNLLGTNSLDQHSISVNADRVSYLNENKVNTGDIRSVEDTVFDLRSPKEISKLLREDHEQFKITRHIDHAFLGNQVVLSTPKKELVVKTTTPAVQLYLSNYFDEGFLNEHNELAANHSSVAIEPQHIPNDINMKRYTHEDPYKEIIIYALTVKD